MTPFGAGAKSSKLKAVVIWNVCYCSDSIFDPSTQYQASPTDYALAALRNPTNPDSAAESSASSVADHNLMPPAPLLGGPSSSGTGTVTPGPDNTFGEQNYEVFDPLNWMLDGLVDFPYSLGHGLDSQGLI